MRILSILLFVLSILNAACSAPPAEVAEIDHSVEELAGGNLTKNANQADTGSSDDVMSDVTNASSSYPQIDLNSTVTGIIGIGDASYWWDPDNKFYRDIYLLEAAPGTEITITLTSSDFDAFAIVRDPQDESTRLHTDDNSAGGTDSQLSFVMSTHSVLVDATTNYPAKFGGYTLSVTSGSQNMVLHNYETVHDYLGEGDTRLTTERYFDTWSYSGTAQTRITITGTSDAFSPYIYVLDGPLGNANILGSGYVNGQVEIILPHTQGYEILVTSMAKEAAGNYSLSLVSEYLTQPTITPVSGSDAVPDSNGKYAVLVGVSDYPGVDQDIPGAVNDVWAMRNVLVFDYGFEWDNVLLILDENATRDAIFSAFQDHLGQAGTNGVALFYYSGHGSHAPGNLGLTAPLDPETEDGVDEALLLWGENATTTLLLDDELGFLSDQLVADRSLIILDSCFSGTGTRAPGAVAKSASWTSLEAAGYASIPEDLNGPPIPDGGSLDPNIIRIDDMLIDRPKAGAIAKGFLSHESNLWDDNTVAIQYDPNLDPSKKALFQDAASIWERLTPISFVDRLFETDYLYVTDLPDSLGAIGVLGDSYVGNSDYFDGQPIRFLDGVSLRTYLHEIGHALGLHHEQARFDRNRYIDVRFENMIDGIANNFRQVDGVSCTEYDFESVMHYGATSGSKDGTPTLVPKPAYSQYAETIGTRATLSDGDIESITRMYTGNCGGGSSEPDAIADAGAPIQHLLLYAARNDQQAWALEETPSGDGPMSVFTYYLTEALKENSSTLNFESLIDKVAGLTEARVDELGLSAQTPGIEGREKRRQLGDYMALTQ